eukprot:scaffold16412_cov59-Phaeocystis_antarctica.AAC.2
MRPRWGLDEGRGAPRPFPALCRTACYDPRVGMVCVFLEWSVERTEVCECVEGKSIRITRRRKDFNLRDLQRCNSSWLVAQCLGLFRSSLCETKGRTRKRTFPLGANLRADNSVPPASCLGRWTG